MTERVAATCRLLLLGTPRVHGEQGVTDLPETAPAFLIVYLAVLRQWAARETVAALLWPELPNERGQHNVRVALNRAGALLERVGLAGALVAERRRIRLDAPNDVADFRDAVAAGDWARACALVDAPLLDGVRCQPYPALAEWMAVEREAQRRQWRRALAEAGQASALPDGALDRYLAAHPADVEMATLQVARLAASRRLAEVRNVIEGFRRAARDELPPSEVDAVTRQIERAASGASSVLASVAEDRGIVGRDGDLAALGDVLAAQHLVTVCGLPGVGKSALLRAFVARRRANRGDRPPEGAADAERAAWIEVGDRSTAAALLERIVVGLTGKPAPRVRTDDGLRLLEPVRGLLVLDGFDQAPAAAGLLDLLAAMRARAPGVRLLVSSRRPLALEGEHVLTLASLPTQAGKPANTASDSENGPSPAAALFLREARRTRPGFDLETSPLDVERIVHASGGLPLALKLAAGWTRWLAAQAIAAELERGVHRVRGALDPSLHELMRSTWQRLDEREREAIEALSLMPRGFDMRAAVVVADQPAGVIEALLAAGLVEMHLAGAVPALGVHPLVKAHAEERLRAAPQRQREAAARFVDWLRERYGNFTVIQGQPVIPAADVAPLIDETVQGWSLALHCGVGDALPWLLSALLSWHEAVGEYAAGLARLDRAVQALDEGVPAEAALLARLHAARATLAHRIGNQGRAVELGLLAERVAAATGQGRVRRQAMNIIGLGRWRQLRLDEAQAAFEDALADALAHDDSRGIEVSEANLALLEKAKGDYVAAERRMRRLMERLGDAGNRWSAFNVRNNLANLLKHLGRLDESEALALQALNLAHQHQLLGARPHVLVVLARLQWRKGLPGRALEYLALLAPFDAALVEPAVLVDASQLRATIALDRGQPDEAHAHVVLALRICQRTNDPSARAEILAIHGRSLWDQGRLDEAHRLWLTVLNSPASTAVLRDGVRSLLGERGLSADGAGDVDVALLVEHLLAA